MEPVRPWCVVVVSAEFKPMDLAQAVAGVRKAPVQDLAGAARKCRGIWESDSDEGACRAIAAAMSAKCECLAVPAALIEDPPAAAPAGRLDLAAVAPRLEGLAAAAFRVVTSRKIKVQEGPGTGQRLLGLGLTLATGLPINVGGKKREVEKSVENADLAFHLDLLLKGPPERLRVNGQAFDYSGLKDKAYDALSNFRRLLGALSQAAPGTRISRGARLFLENKPLLEAGYESLDDLERESRWLATVLALKK